MRSTPDGTNWPTEIQLQNVQFTSVYNHALNSFDDIQSLFKAGEKFGQ